MSTVGDNEHTSPHAHLIGVCGTGMGALAGLLSELGYRVTGSDRAFDPPMGPALKAWGIETMQGFRADNLNPTPDLVVVGNVCRPDNPEARAAIDGDLNYTSMPALLESAVLQKRRSIVIAGTHGKTTTTSLLSHLLTESGHNPGFLVGGIPTNFDRSFATGVEGGPFVIEGDEYDSAFFDKTPKFWKYAPLAAALTSIEFDHADIYDRAKTYVDAFVKFVDTIPTEGTLVAWAGDPTVRRVASKARCRVVYYALDDDDCGDVTPLWSGALFDGAQDLVEVRRNGSSTQRVRFALFGAHNTRNLLAALTLGVESVGAELAALIGAAQSFAGVARRQQLVGTAHGVKVYDDFAHHPTAVAQTLKGFARAYPNARLLVAFEPRSATASRNFHQQDYPDALSIADRVYIAPVGRSEIADEERLDTARVAAEVAARGRHAVACDSVDALVDLVSNDVAEGDIVVAMSNGRFGDAPNRMLAGIEARFGKDD